MHSPVRKRTHLVPGSRGHSWFWSNSKLSEVPVQTKTAYNDYSFRLLTPVACDSAGIRMLLDAVTNAAVRNVILYHREAMYTPGTSATMLWLAASDVLSRLGALSGAG